MKVYKHDREEEIISKMAALASSFAPLLAFVQ
jgi:hypothetical protein